MADKKKDEGKDAKELADLTDHEGGPQNAEEPPPPTDPGNLPEPPANK